MGFSLNGNFGFGSGGGSGSATVTGANDGLSLTGANAQLGQTVGQLGNPAILLENREIPTGGFSILMSGAGNLVVGSATDGGQKLQIIGTTVGVQQLTKVPAGQTVATPIYQIQKSDGTPWFAMNTNAPGNVFIGINSGIVCTTPASTFGLGGANTAIGSNALAANTDGNSNNAFGLQALLRNTTGQQNVAMGVNAMFSNTTGNTNTAMGQAAVAFNTTGSGNTGIGHDALRQNTTGLENVGIGEFALMNNQTGSLNVAIGASALAQGSESALFTMDNNIGIGYRAGFGLTAIGTLNIIIGWDSFEGGNLGSNNISIGASQSMGASLSNLTMIGTGMNSSVANIAGLGLATQNVIVGITTITADNGARLQVSGNQSLGVVASAAGTLNLDATATHYVFTGTTTTWTLPVVASHTGWYYLIKNRGSGAITLNSNAGGNDIYNTSAVNTFTINAGQAFIVANDGTFWLIE